MLPMIAAVGFLCASVREVYRRIIVATPGELVS